MIRFVGSRYFLFILVMFVAVVMGREFIMAVSHHERYNSFNEIDSTWRAPSLLLDNELTGEQRTMVIYGEELVSNTSRYFGPQGKIRPMSNGMNCQNCHLDAGTRPWGNNYSMVYSTYPKFRARSGMIENLYKRVNDCFERSLNGQSIDSNSREFLAISSYINWVGKDVNKDAKPVGAGIEKLPFLNRPADPDKGKSVYDAKCSSCHGANGAGVLAYTGDVYTYPPLWGSSSYNDGAGLFRISNFAGFVKSNMPFGQSSHQSPALSNEEAWDVAAFVNSRPRPHKDQQGDWPNPETKPVDFPFGPYTDTFTEQQHKFGPFQQIAALKK